MLGHVSQCTLPTANSPQRRGGTSLSSLSQDEPLLPPTAPHEGGRKQGYSAPPPGRVQKRGCSAYRLSPGVGLHENGTRLVGGHKLSQGSLL